MAIYQVLHQKSNADRLHLTRKKGGKGLITAEESVNIDKRTPGKYLKIRLEE